jgi:hypothetical protein
MNTIHFAPAATAAEIRKSLRITRSHDANIQLALKAAGVKFRNGKGVRKYSSAKATEVRFAK